MQQVSNRKFLLLGLIISGFLGASFVQAQVCPICVVAIGAGLGLSRWFGIDDIVSSIWIGAFLIAMISWTLSFMKKRKWDFTDDGIVITLAYIVLTYIPLYYAKIVGHPLNQIWGIDKIIFGSTVGAIFLFLGNWLHLYLKKRNNGKSFFPYQRVAIPVIVLLLTSIVFYFLLTYRLI